ncbi:MAG: hypothetical protein IJH42_04655 [Atopobiaceae bacterium]|nr:hypothetical protein [Atopobiaceae bacterium]
MSEEITNPEQVTAPVETPGEAPKPRRTRTRKMAVEQPVAADTGGFVTNGSGTLVDLYMDSYGECTQWGKRNVTIYVISWGNGRV